MKTHKSRNPIETHTARSPIETLDAIEHHVAASAAEEGRASDADRKWSRDLGLKINARLAELRRQHTPVDVTVEQAKPIRASTLGMARDALIAAITRITDAMGGTVQYAHRNLTGLSDDDLRRLYDTIDPTADVG